MKLIVHYTDGKSWTYTGDNLSYYYDGISIVIADGKFVSDKVDKKIITIESPKETFIPDDIVAGIEIHHPPEDDDFYGIEQGRVEFIRFKKNFSVSGKVVRNRVESKQSQRTISIQSRTFKQNAMSLENAFKQFVGE